MAFADRLLQAREAVALRWRALSAPYPACCLIFSVSDGPARAVVVSASGPDLDSAWQQGIASLQTSMRRRRLEGHWLRVDWVTRAQAMSREAFIAQLHSTKRNYFRHGLAFDTDLKTAMTEQELNAHAVWYAGGRTSHAALNENNLRVYAAGRFATPGWTIPQTPRWHCLTTAGIFVDASGSHALVSTGLGAGRRAVVALQADDVLAMVRSASDFLARQVDADGRFVYGHYPCFARNVSGYNTLRHASTTYAMIEAWEETQSPALAEAIARSLAYLEREWVRIVAHDEDGPVAMLVDMDDEIKLGGNAVLILALTRHAQATGKPRGLALAQALARGIRRMQDARTGRFVHVLHHPSLAVKAEHRIIYYDGEAAFALMRLYQATGQAPWLAMVEKAFGHFIAAEHWRAHDHWLSYCVNELTRVRPDPAYFQFGLRNVKGYLGFVTDRITTFPTLLELMMAARAMLERLSQDPAHAELYRQIDPAAFEHALETRAHRLLDGFFWPELAMAMRQPDSVVGSFFIRHHAFRVRIDDVEHYLSGYIAYLAYLRRGRPRLPAEPALPGSRGMAAPTALGLTPGEQAASEPAGSRASAPLLVVVGDLGRAILPAMLAQALRAFGPVGQVRQDPRTPLALATDIATLPPDTRYVVCDLAGARQEHARSWARAELMVFSPAAPCGMVDPAHTAGDPDALTQAEWACALVQTLPPGGTAIIDRDVLHADEVIAAAQARSLRVLTYGADVSADVRLRSIDPTSTLMMADVAGRGVSVRLGTPGAHCVTMALAVLATAQALGLSLLAVVAALAQPLGVADAAGAGAHADADRDPGPPVRARQARGEGRVATAP